MATWAKLSLGTAGVVLGVGALGMLYVERDARAEAEGGSLTADVLPVGTDYGGLIVEQRVEVGDHVAEGDVLFVIESLNLERELQARQDAAEATAEHTGEEPEEVEVTDLWEVKATADGTVSEIPVLAGGYVGQGGVIARLYASGTLAAATAFRLDARDIARVTEGAAATLRLPDGTEIAGDVDAMRVTTDDLGVLVVLDIASEQLAQAQAEGLTLPGTPVSASVELTPAGPLSAEVREAARSVIDRLSP